MRQEDLRDPEQSRLMPMWNRDKSHDLPQSLPVVLASLNAGVCLGKRQKVILLRIVAINEP